MAAVVYAPGALIGQNRTVDQAGRHPGGIEQISHRCDVPDDLRPGEMVVAVTADDGSQLGADRIFPVDIPFQFSYGRLQMAGHIKTGYLHQGNAAVE